MTAELLRRAAKQARHEAHTLETLAPHMVTAFNGDDQGCSRDAQRHRAVADWLDRVADDWDIAKFGYWSRCSLDVARAYLQVAADA